MSAIRGRRLGAGVGLVSTVLVGSALAAGPARAVAGFTVVSTTYSAPTISVSGLSIATLTMTAHITDGTALPLDDGYLTFQVQRSAGPGPLTYLSAGATFVSGSATDGVWSAALPIPSTAGGTWSLTTIFEEGIPGPIHDVTGAPTFTVVASHAPALSMGSSPAVVRTDASPYTVKGRLTDSTTGQGMAGVALRYGIDNQCAEAPLGGTATTVTNAAGYYGFPPQTSLYAKQSLNCALLFAPGSGSTVILERPLSLTLQTSVTAIPAQSRVRVGTIVPVDGAIPAGSGCPVQLLRLSGSTVWRVVSTATVRSSGRYTLTAQPSVVGSNIYRVLLPRCGRLLAASSTQRVITGTA